MPLIQTDGLDVVCAVVEQFGCRVIQQGRTVHINFSRTGRIHHERRLLGIGIRSEVSNQGRIAVQSETEVRIGGVVQGDVPVQYLPKQEDLAHRLFSCELHRNSSKVSRIHRHVEGANVHRIHLHLAHSVDDEGQRYRFHFIAILEAVDEHFRAPLLDEVVDFVHVGHPAVVAPAPTIDVTIHLGLDDVDHAIEHSVHVVTAEVRVAQVRPAVDVGGPEIFIFHQGIENRDVTLPAHVTE